MSFRYKGAIKSINGPTAKSGSWTQQKVMQGYNGSGVWSGNVITNSPVIPNGNGATNTASGIWTMDEAAYWANNAAWPNQYADQYFYDVTMLLSGNGTKQINIGGQGSAYYMTQGYIDDVRITKGYARYTANFTPPTSAFMTY